MPACGSGSIRIETLSLDEAARAYECHLRAQRFLRAMVGQLTPVFTAPLIWAVVTPLFYFILPSEERKVSLVTVVAVEIGVFGPLVFIYLYFWMLRAFAAGSLRAARVVLAIISFGALFQVLGLLVDIFDFATVDAGSGDWSQRPMYAVSMAAELMALFVTYLMLTGPARILRFRKSPIFPLFLNHNYQREFWPGRAIA